MPILRYDTRKFVAVMRNPKRQPWLSSREQVLFMAIEAGQWRHCTVGYWRTIGTIEVI